MTIERTHHKAIWFFVPETGGYIAAHDFEPSTIDGNYFGPYSLEFDIPPEVLTEAYARQEERRIEGEVKKAPKVKGRVRA